MPWSVLGEAVIYRARKSSTVPSFARHTLEVGSDDNQAVVRRCEVRTSLIAVSRTVAGAPKAAASEFGAPRSRRWPRCIAVEQRKTNLRSCQPSCGIARIGCVMPHGGSSQDPLRHLAAKSAGGCE